MRRIAAFACLAAAITIAGCAAPVNYSESAPDSSVAVQRDLEVYRSMVAVKMTLPAENVSLAE